MGLVVFMPLPVIIPPPLH